MRVSRERLLVLLGVALMSACHDEPAPTSASTAPPAVANANTPVGFVVGQTVAYDATRGGTVFSAPAITTRDGRGDRGTIAAALTYRVNFEGNMNGLAAVGSMVTGKLLAPGVTWATITATDGQGRTASDRFAIVAFDSTLATPTLPAVSYHYTDAANPLPEHFKRIIDGASVAATDNTPLGNPITDAGASLGRALFYDVRLSANDALSCAGCHSPFIAFGDSPQLSIGFNGALTGRHTPALTNARFYQRGRFFWDERAVTLEDQVLGPIQSPVEMGMSLENLVAKITVTAYYPALFQEAFGSTTVTSERIARALAQYVRSLVSTNSRYDRALAGTATLSAQEQMGEALFRSTGCASCHTTVSQVSDSVHNIGLDATDTDVGAGRGAFKAPSLRNVAAHAPFMHDGRFTTLEQVVEFFDSGVRPNPNLDLRLRDATGTPKRLGLTAAERAALVAFLNTLTDSTFLNAPRFANPFAKVGSVPPPAPVPPTTPAPPTTPGTPPTPPPAPATAAVLIQANSFRPPTVTVAAGGVVTWTNLDNSRHGVGFQGTGPGNTPVFSSGSQSVAMPLTPGTYNYQCLVHGAQMRGTVIVQ